MTDQILPDAELCRQLDAMRAACRRLCGTEIGGRMVWIKLALRKSLRIQISKGLPRALLAREGALLRGMAARGAPVPPILAQGDDYLVLADCGRVLTDHMDECQNDPQRAARLMTSVGQALARLHDLGCTHGRPYIRDILIGADGAVTFTDMERGARFDAGERFQCRDLAMMVLSVYGRWIDPGRAEVFLAPLLTAYFAAAPAGRAARVAAWTRRWRWAVFLTAPARWREKQHKPHKLCKEYQALPLTLDRLARAAQP